MFDISTLAFDSKATVTLKNPVTGDDLITPVLNDDGSPKLNEAGEPVTAAVTVVLYGKSSTQYRNAETTMLNRRLRATQRKEKPDAETFRSESLDVLVACVAGFQNLTINGEVPSTPAAIRDVLANPKLSWIRTQVDEALGDDSNFLAQ